MEDISPRQKCSHCCQISDNWLWRLVESFPAYQYEILCQACCRSQDASFTADLAIREAECRIIIWQGIHQGKMNRQVAK